ncbi:MAG: hypothetical protein OFPII_40970 [Osedax symbiont Rs1]|nr:MAG: hypothetical protein OFPII_40970 [Osedax symbiont Rs1]
MFIDQQVAQKIVDRAMKIIQYNVNVMNHLGEIVGSGDQQRIGLFHTGALDVLDRKKEVDFDRRQADALSGVQQGINLPIVCNGEIIGVVGITGMPSEVSKYADLVVMTSELMVEQAALSAQVQWDKRQLENVICRLIQGDIEKSSLFDDRIERLKIDLSIPRVAVIIDVSDADTQQDLPLATLQSMLRMLDSNAAYKLLAISCPTQIVILMPVTVQQSCWDEWSAKIQLESLCQLLAKQYHLHYKVSMGQYFPDIAGLAKSYQSALQILAAGKLSLPEQVLYFPDAAALDVLLKSQLSSWSADKLLVNYQLLVAADKKAVLLNTLAVYFQHSADFGKTANALHIHRNTLRYRLDRIDQILNIQLANIDDLLRLYLAFKLANMQVSKQLH